MTLRKRLAEHAQDYRTLQPNSKLADDLVEAIDELERLQKEIDELKSARPVCLGCCEVISKSTMGETK